MSFNKVILYFMIQFVFAFFSIESWSQLYKSYSLRIELKSLKIKSIKSAINVPSLNMIITSDGVFNNLVEADGKHNSESDQNILKDCQFKTQGINVSSKKIKKMKLIIQINCPNSSTMPQKITWGPYLINENHLKEFVRTVSIGSQFSPLQWKIKELEFKN